MPRLLSETEKAPSNQNLSVEVGFTSSSSGVLTEVQMTLANDLSRVHGRIRVAREASGLHFYMASPICLEQDGAVELTKLHLAVNVDKFLDRHRTFAAMCMKTGQTYAVPNLLDMPPLSERGFSQTKAEVIMMEENRDALEQDARGNWIPKGPGELIPVNQLVEGHPAIDYLLSRNYDPDMLYSQFRASFCVKENSDVYYRRLINGFKATPQGRIVFFIDQYGIQRGWQARILDMVEDNEDGSQTQFVWHPYQERWVAVQDRKSPEVPWVLRPNWEAWDPPKYIIGTGAKRNQCIMGLDAALRCVTDGKLRDSRGRSFCILSEGALDAGRYGSPGVASMGKYLSPDQARILSECFQRVIYVPDNDKAGVIAREKFAKAMAQHPDVKAEVFPLPDQFKDFGLVPSYAEAHALIDLIL